MRIESPRSDEIYQLTYTVVLMECRFFLPEHLVYGRKGHLRSFCKNVKIAENAKNDLK